MQRFLVRSLVPVYALAASSLPATALAQTGLPGGRGGSAPAHMAAYYAYMLEQVQYVTSEYEAAWSEQDFERMEKIFHEESALVVDAGSRVRGRDAVLARLREMWPARWHVRLTIVDFEASGDLAVVYGQLGEAPGRHITLIKRFGDDWKIVRQFLLGPAPASFTDSTAAPVPGRDP